MISVKPGSIGLLALGFIVARPGKLDAAALGQEIWRPKITGPADVLAARAAILAQGTPPVRTAARAKTPIPAPPVLQTPWSEDASKLLHGLQKMDLIERCRPPLVAEEWETMADEDPAEVIRLAGCDVYPAPDPTGLRAALLALLVRRKPPTVKEWVGAGPSGHIQGAIADLVAWGVVIPPSFRWPTERGVDLVVAALLSPHGAVEVAPFAPSRAAGGAR